MYMGDFNLKTAPDYKIPEHMRVNAAKKEEELGHLDSMVLLTHCSHDEERHTEFLVVFCAETTHFTSWPTGIYSHRNFELKKVFVII